MEFSWENFPLLVGGQLRAFLNSLVFLFKLDILACHYTLQCDGSAQDDTTQCQVIEKSHLATSSIFYTTMEVKICLCESE